MLLYVRGQREGELLQAVVPVAAAAWETVDADTFVADAVAKLDACPKPCGEA